jgi:C_GCAxxG_C_C family probable redox protein
MGQSGGTCGAITGAYMVLGMAHQPSADTLKDEAGMAAAMAEFNRRFKALHGSLKCTELIGYDLSVPGEADEAFQKDVFTNVCPGLVRDAVEILVDLLKVN